MSGWKKYFIGRKVSLAKKVAIQTRPSFIFGKETFCFEERK
jgi:hypothetical protein